LGPPFLVDLLEALYYFFDRLITRASRDMASQQHEGGGLKWPPRRFLTIHRRGLLMASLIFFAISVVCFVKVASLQIVNLERRTLAERQFQLGGFLGGIFREVMGIPVPNSHGPSI
jgi:hypothetical protein